jgi:hypothetical protein
MRAVLITLLLVVAEPSFAQSSDDPSIRMITTDLDRFWKAFDAFKKDTTTNPLGEYMRKGTPAFVEFAEHRIKDSVSFKKIVRKEFAYYDSIRSSSYRLLDFTEKISDYFNRFRAIYPDADKPDFYLVVGQMNTGSISVRDGVVVAVEVFSDKTYKLKAGTSSTPVEKLGLTAIFGLIFYNQKPAHTGFTVLRQSIVQGSADFIATLIVGSDSHQILSQKHYLYGEQHEELIVREFMQQKNSDDFSSWLYHPPKGDRPADLGSWIGFKITEAYYNNTPNKTKAIDDILKINDFEKFLLLSGYLEPFKNK